VQPKCLISSNFVDLIQTNYLKGRKTVLCHDMMALKMLYRGPSSRLENLIEKIQATKEITNNGNFLRISEKNFWRNDH